MSKVVFIVLDGVGIGELPDAADYGDEGSNTLANTAEAVGGLHLPHLERLGLGNIHPIKGIARVDSPAANFGRMREVSKGKDSTTGHWELSGLILEKDFPTFPNGFPGNLLKQFLQVAGCKGYLGNTAASGTAIIQELGDDHVKSGFPIVYTSADSVFQIAADEEVIPLPKLYTMCQQARDAVCIDEYAVGRVIARPFVGTSGKYTRTTNRRDFSLLPPRKTVLDLLSDSGIDTVGIGKIDDLFAGRGLTTKIHTKSNADGISRTIAAANAMETGLIFTNLVDFDQLYGHRNDPVGFARSLAEFDGSVPSILDTLNSGDMLIVTADHGNDPVTPSTDHSREYVPLLCMTKQKNPGIGLGTRDTFADIGKTIADFFGVSNVLSGRSFLQEVMAR